ncbi:MAG: DUF4386 domain-containing protein [Xanthomonadales bacterium]|nr:DUF4386 domain-containing protein [Xanthomonadales bacterium]
MTSLIANPGRRAGLLYLFIVLTAPVHLLYIPGRLFVRGDAAATMANVLANETLFRGGIALELVGAAVWAGLLLALYWLFRGVDKRLSVLMVMLGAIPMLAASVLSASVESTALMVARGADFLGVFDIAERGALFMLLMRVGGYATSSVELFWGLWLLPLGMLVLRSRQIPRLLGFWLLLNGLAYALDSLLSVLVAGPLPALDMILPVLQFGEVAFMLWLLAKGMQPALASTPATAGAAVAIP